MRNHLNTADQSKMYHLQMKMQQDEKSLALLNGNDESNDNFSDQTEELEEED